jgi:diguanylate cyclase (GGDEF)-like protein
MMKKIWEFYENMNELVYVSDMDSYEITYMNRKARELYGLKTPKDYEGKCCYEVLQGCANPCKICTSKHLRPGYFEEWRYYNPILRRTFALKDTLMEYDGHRYRVELAIDMTTEEQQRETIRKYMDNETMISEGLRISLKATDPDESIELLLEYLGHALKSERVYIFEEKPGRLYDNTYEWCANGVIPQKENLKQMSGDIVKIWMDHFENGENMVIEDVESIRDKDPLMYECLLPQNIRSLVTSPLVYNNEIIGFYGVDNPPSDFLRNISTLFKIMGHFIVSMLRRRDLVRRLEEMSYYDQLTGFKNRHGMDDYITRMDPEKSLGVVYVDVTGLKWVNDHQGHQAGDALLLRACRCIKKVFPEDARFRIGGDEFLVLCSGITQEELEKRVQKLRAETKDQDVILAIGLVWRTDGKENMDKILTEADHNMYEDKRAYYASTGARDRRQ